MCSLLTHRGCLSQPEKEKHHGRKETSLQIPQQQEICGVCAGFADYLNLDPTIVRVLWALLAVFAGTGILAYFICALVMPEDDTQV